MVLFKQNNYQTCDISILGKPPGVSGDFTNEVEGPWQGFKQASRSWTWHVTEPQLHTVEYV